MTDQKRLMNPRETAEYLGIHLITLYRMMKRKALPGFKVGGQWRFKQDELDEFFKKMK